MFSENNPFAIRKIMFQNNDFVTSFPWFPLVAEYSAWLKVFSQKIFLNSFQTEIAF